MPKISMMSFMDGPIIVVNSYPPPPPFPLSLIHLGFCSRIGTNSSADLVKVGVWVWAFRQSNSQGLSKVKLTTHFLDIYLFI